jgi:hypothetical protein
LRQRQASRRKTRGIFDVFEGLRCENEVEGSVGYGPGVTCLICRVGIRIIESLLGLFLVYHTVLRLFTDERPVELHTASNVEDDAVLP